MSSASRAPLPTTHRRRWVGDQDDAEKQILPNESLDQRLSEVLKKATSHYDHPGHQPPNDFDEEKARILADLRARADSLPVDDYESRIVLIVAMAILNPIRLSIDADRFGEHVKMTVNRNEKESESDARLAKFFTREYIGTIEEPATVVDVHGRILMWYLPDILGAQVEKLNTATKHLQNLLANSVHSDSSTTAPWRTDPNNFCLPDGEQEFEGGCVDFASSWFQARRERLEDIMTPSQSLSQKGVPAWITAIKDVESELNGLFSLVAPSLHESGTVSTQRLKETHKDHKTVPMWPSVFTGIGVIVNRITPPHRDKGGCLEWYDLLVAAGTYDDAYMEVDDIQGHFRYRPGTAIFICGKLFRHAVKEWSGGERICYAHYMRNNVLHRLGLEKASWVKESHFTASMSSKFLARRRL